MLLKVDNGGFYYEKQKPIFKNINLEMDKSEIMAVMGQNGIGKTTLIKCIAGILHWKVGYSKILDKINKKGEFIREVGYVPQSHKISYSYSVRDMVVFGRASNNSYLAKPSKLDYEHTDEILETVGIINLRNKSCNELSGGQLQLVFIARALVNYPKLLILDEPESHLDFKNQLKLLNLIEELVKSREMSCILNTHYIDNALKIASKSFLLGNNGYIVGDIKDIMTEENIERYFLVKSKSISVKYKNKDITSFIFLD